MYQGKREKAFKIALLNQQLQDYNAALGDALQRIPLEEDAVQDYLDMHPIPSVRVTILDSHGFVLFDNRTKEYPNLSDHRSRKEIREALSGGSGYCIDRQSITVDDEYFYSATWIPRGTATTRCSSPRG